MATIDLTKDSDDEQAPAPQQPQRDDDEAASLALARQLQAEEAPPRRADERPAKRARTPQIERVHAAGGVLDPTILARVDAIVQQSNCVGCDGRGLAAAIAEELPYGNTYKDSCACGKVWCTAYTLTRMRRIPVTVRRHARW